MSELQSPATERSHPVRTITSPIVNIALIMEQGKRQNKTGKRANKMDIAAEWLEEKAQSVLDSKE